MEKNKISYLGMGLGRVLFTALLVFVLSALTSGGWALRSFCFRARQGKRNGIGAAEDIFGRRLDARTFVVVFL